MPLPEPNSSASDPLAGLRWDAAGLVAAVVQQAAPDDDGRRDAPPPTGRVLMLAWMNRESLSLTLQTRRMHYWSRSRNKLWLKGETSGHFQEVVRWHRDCDGDALLFVVRQTAAACHNGYESCFYQEMDFAGNPLPLRESPRFEPTQVYAPASA